MAKQSELEELLRLQVIQAESLAAFRREMQGQTEVVQDLIARVALLESGGTEFSLRRNGGGVWVIRITPLKTLLVLLLAAAAAFGVSDELLTFFRAT